MFCLPRTPLITNREIASPLYSALYSVQTGTNLIYREIRRGVERLVLSKALLMKLSPKFMDLHSERKSRTGQTAVLKR